MARYRFGVPLVLFLASAAFAQTQPQSDPQAVSLATQAMTALTNGVSVGDITLSGNAISTSALPAQRFEPVPNAFEELQRGVQ